MKIYNFYNFKKVFKLIKKLFYTTFYNYKFFNIKLNFINLFTFKFELIILINKFRV